MELQQQNETLDVTAFDALLASIYDNFQLTQTVNEASAKSLKRLVCSPKEDMDSTSYVKIMYLYGIWYEQNNNKNAARYCAMRILTIMDCLHIPGKKRPRMLDIQPYQFPDDMESFVERYTDFLEQTYRNINRRLMVITGILFLVVFLVLVLVLRIGVFMAGMESLILGMLNYLLQKKRMPEIFQKNQLRAIEKYVDAELLEFDRPIRFM